MAGPEPRIRHSFPARIPSHRSTTNRLSNPNVFSDDYALESLESPVSPSLSPVDSNESISRPSTPQASATRLIDSSRPIVDTAPARPRDSTAKRTFSQRYNPSSAVPDRVQSTVSRISMATSATRRTASTASRFSIPRAPSPYNGATGPSHPYQMYPQVTRTSSASTIRPNETAFTGSSSPEHPYGMYPQSTLPEEEAAAAVSTNAIPVGFPGMGQGYQRRLGPEGEDVADIIGPDGHTEQLPPYTRYPDDMPRKRDPAAAEVPVVALAADGTRDPPLSEMTNTHEPVQMGDATGARDGDEESTWEQGGIRGYWKRNSRKRVCCGLPLRTVLGIAGLILLAATIGGVIGSIVGATRRPKHHGGSPDHTNGTLTSPDAEMGATSSATTTVTATSWVDATALPSSSTVGSIPTGQYSVPLNQVKATSATCVDNLSLSSTWQCMPPMSFDINVSAIEGSSTSQVQFQLPEMNYLSYGAQPPNIGSEFYNLTDALDKDDIELGAAEFFFTEFTKMVILPSQAIAATSTSKRSIVSWDILQTRDNHGGVQPSDTPWFCYWNATVLEFFIYTYQFINSTSNSSSTTTTTSAAAAASSTTAASRLLRRDYNSNDQYPRYVKVEEKRKPSGDVTPYCVQMQSESGSWVPVPNVATVTVSETEPGSATTSATPSSTAVSKARSIRDVSNSIPIELVTRQDPSGSSCFCEWLAT